MRRPEDTHSLVGVTKPEHCFRFCEDSPRRLLEAFPSGCEIEELGHIDPVPKPQTDPGQQFSPSEGWLGECSIASGDMVRFRHVQPDDEPLIVEAISTASPETLLHRFFSPIRHVSPDLLRQMLEIDRSKETCVVGLMNRGGRTRIICGARYIRLPRRDAAEIALTVHDDFQRRGLGSFMMKLIARLARSEGINWFEADVMSSNAAMLKLLRAQKPPGRGVHTEGDVEHIVVNITSGPLAN